MVEARQLTDTEKIEMIRKLLALWNGSKLLNGQEYEIVEKIFNCIEHDEVI